MSCGQVRGLSWRKLSRDIGGLGAQFQCRLFLLVQALTSGAPAGSSEALFRSLCALPGGIGRFMPCGIGASHCRLRHIGWEKCGHGLTSRPRESASEGFLNELLLLLRYPSRSAAALLEGALPLRYCAGGFASRIPTWRYLLMVMLLIWLRGRGSWYCSVFFLGDKEPSTTHSCELSRAREWRGRRES